VVLSWLVFGAVVLVLLRSRAPGRIEDMAKTFLEPEPPETGRC